MSGFETEVKLQASGSDFFAITQRPMGRMVAWVVGADFVFHGCETKFVLRNRGGHTCITLL
jgi:hypothetical protein